MIRLFDRDLAAAHSVAVGHHAAPPLASLLRRGDVGLQFPKAIAIRLKDTLPRLVAEEHDDLLDLLEAFRDRGFRDEAACREFHQRQQHKQRHDRKQAAFAKRDSWVSGVCRQGIHAQLRRRMGTLARPD